MEQQPMEINFTLGTETGNVEIFRVSLDGKGVRVFDCDLTPDRLARACAAFLVWHTSIE